MLQAGIGPPRSWRFFDTLGLAQQYASDAGVASANLGRVAEAMQLSWEGDAHRAEADVRMLIKVGGRWGLPLGPSAGPFCWGLLLVLRGVQLLIECSWWRAAAAGACAAAAAPGAEGGRCARRPPQVSERLLQHSGRGSLEALLAASTTHTGHWHELVSELGKAQRLTEQQRKKRKSRGTTAGTTPAAAWPAAPQPAGWPYSAAAGWPAAGAQAPPPAQPAPPAQQALQLDEERELAGALAAAGQSSDDEAPEAGPSSEEAEAEGSEAPEQLEAVGQGLARLEERALDESQVGPGRVDCGWRLGSGPARGVLPVLAAWPAALPARGRRMLLLVDDWLKRAPCLPRACIAGAARLDLRRPRCGAGGRRRAVQWVPPLLTCLPAASRCPARHLSSRHAAAAQRAGRGAHSPTHRPPTAHPPPGPPPAPAGEQQAREQLSRLAAPSVLDSWWPCAVPPASLAKTWTEGQLKKLGSRSFKHGTLLQLLLAAPHMDPYYLRLSEPPTVQNVLVRAQVLANKSRWARGWCVGVRG
jgi:hypothetical protein